MMRMQHKRLKLWIGALGVCGLTMISGCGEAEGPLRFPVAGQVLLKDKPVAEAMVVFHAIGGVPSSLPKPIAFTDADGHYQVSTLGNRDGAVPGAYKITVELRAMRQVGDEPTRDGPNLLPAKYADPATTPFECQVQETANEVTPLQLTVGK